MKQGAYDGHGSKIPSQHSPLWPGKRIAGLPGNTPHWLESVMASWNKYESRDARKRAEGKLPYDDDRRPLVIPPPVQPNGTPYPIVRVRRDDLDVWPAA